MATDNQIEANRLNAQHCTGPKTEEGKARSSQNALKTGIYSKSELLVTESREALDELVADFHTRFAPATPEERSMVDALIRYEWLSRRYMAADTAVWNWQFEGEVPNVGRAFARSSEMLARAGRYFHIARKGFSTTLKELKAIQAERKAERNSEPGQSPVPNRDCKGAVTQPSEQPNQPLTPKLVSFRQPEITAQVEPQQIAELDEKQPEQQPEAPQEAA